MGSPTSKFDSRDLWKKYDYRDFGIIGEPYFDIDFSKVLYLSDTGRRWDGDKFNVRDRVLRPEARGEGQSKSEIRSPKSETNSNVRNPNDQNRMSHPFRGRGPEGNLEINGNRPEARGDRSEKDLSPDAHSLSPSSFHSTFDIINAIENNQLPDQIMINTHPQRWTNNPFLWTKELVWQNMKNQIKRLKKK